jgi:hypothetical protein
VALFKPQELANVVWAFASQDFYHKELMDAVAARALTMVDQFKEQELSNVLWAFGKLKHYDKVLFLRMLGSVAVKLPHFLPQGVSNVAWALAAVGHKDPLLFDQLVGHCMADIGSYDVQVRSRGGLIQARYRYSDPWKYVHVLLLRSSRLWMLKVKCYYFLAGVQVWLYKQLLCIDELLFMICM